ncbi:MAG: GTP-binding protein [Duncaniella sp.]|nr:GTP-binding protein [Duncaniella sp.]
MKGTITPVLLLTGYLGSGKTTLVNHILTNERGIKFAVIVNDIGEVNIDADLIERGGVVDSKDDSLVALSNGCICCTLKMDLVKQIEDIMAMERFDYIVIEASGICEPAPIAQTICSIPQLGSAMLRHGTPQLDCIVTVVDALRLYDEFESGDSLRKDDLDEEDIENLIIQQIEFCNIILLNKVSEVTPEALKRIRAIINAIQPNAEIIECDYAKVDLAKIVNTGRFHFGEVASSAAWIRQIDRDNAEIMAEEEQHHHHHHHHDEDEHHHADHHHHHDEHCEAEHGGECTCGHHHHHHGEGEAEEYGISTFVYYRRPGFDLNKFDYFCAKHWPKTVIRSKGICYFSNNPDMSYLFETAGRQKQLREAGLWYVTAPEDELQQLLEQDPGLMKDWEGEYGDRMIKLVFIGRDMDRTAITEALDACLDR